MKYLDGYKSNLGDHQCQHSDSKSKMRDQKIHKIACIKNRQKAFGRLNTSYSAIVHEKKMYSV